MEASCYFESNVQHYHSGKQVLMACHQSMHASSICKASAYTTSVLHSTSISALLDEGQQDLQAAMYSIYGNNER